MQKPNIVIFHSHDMGRWIEPYGFPVRTPHLRKFADEAMTFRRAFCVAPTCSPSRAGMLTGCAPHMVNMLGLAHRGFGPVDTSKHLANYLRGQGYRTVLAGVQHEIGKGRAPELGYAEVVPFNPALPIEIRDVALAQELAARIESGFGGQPLFLSFGTFMPHRPFPAAGPDDNPDRLTPPYPVSDTPEGRRDFAEYRAAVAQTDRSFGVLLEALKKTSEWNHTIVVVTTDHGPAFPGMKCTLKDTGIGVSFLLRVPGMASTAGGTCEALVSQIDLFPTLCELAGLPQPDWLQGRSLVPLLDGTQSAIREELFAEVTYHAAYQPMRAVRTARHKLIRHFDPERLRPVLPNVDAGHEKQRLLEAGWDRLGHADTELFDLTTDPWESNNRADDPALAAVRKDLEARLGNWMRQTADPLLENCPRVPAPAGAKVTALRAQEPEEQSFE